MMDLSIVIPIYNAADIILPNVFKIIHSLRKSDLRFEILLRDDGSDDTSLIKLDEVARIYQEVRVFFNGENKGLGWTLRRLFKDAQGQTIIYSDCDLPFGEEIFQRLYQENQTWDVVLASRYGELPSVIPWPRRVASRIYYCFCYLLFRVPVKDLGSGAVAFRRNVLASLNLKSKGFDIHIELFVKVKALDFSIKEFAALSFSVGQSSFRIFRHGFGIVWGTLFFCFFWRWDKFFKSNEIKNYEVN